MAKNKKIYYNTIEITSNRFISFYLKGQDEDGNESSFLFAKCENIQMVNRKYVDFYGNVEKNKVIKVKALQENMLQETI